jgi:DtxR family transcriptional regulator, Mn-dependent transcriptional regulator
MAPSGGLSQDDYLEALYEMAEEGLPTQQARLADWLEVSAATVSEAVGRLSRRGLVRHGEGRQIELTPEGRGLARTLVRRHRLAERFLVEVVRLPWHLAHEEATHWGRVISERVEQRFVEVLGDPGSCVHGNPIPGSRNEESLEDLAALHDVEPGERVRLVRLTEDLELDLGVMRYFEDSGLMPGAELRVLAVAPDGTRTLEVAGDKVALGPHLADNLWVRPA